MLFGNNRNELRRMYQAAWQKACNQQPMTPLESQIADVVGDHSEYHELLSNNSTEPLTQDYTPESGKGNPFLHMSLHLAVRDQVQTDRPPGIRQAFDALCHQSGDRHQSEHRLSEVMGEILWQSQRNQQAPDEQAYLRKVLTLIQKK